MSIAEDFPDHEVKLLFEREELATDLELILSGDPSAADKLARLFDSLCQAMDSGLQGINEVRRVLLTVIELTYLYTGAHVSALRLYRLSLAGHLKVNDEPVRLINAAIGRSARSVRAARRFGRARGSA